LGATQWKLPEHPDVSERKVEENPAFVDVVVCGAHLSGMALNWQLTDRNAVLLEETKTADKYQMFAVSGDVERPAMIRGDANGKSFVVEVWRLPIELFGSFVTGIAQPLGIGKLELADGRWLTGFIAEGYAMEGNNISNYGGWREYKKQSS
jgi:allophanate hydrolase